MKTQPATLSFSSLFRRLFAVGGALAAAAMAQAQAPDAFEEDDTPATAKVILNGVTQNRSIHLGDTDWVTFTIGGAGATALRIETAAPVVGGSGDTELWLYNATNLTKELLYADDGALGKFSLITLANVVPGTYFIRVGAVPVAGAPVAIAAYTLRATWTDRADSFEADNTAATAKAIANGETQERSIHVANDEDWVSFTVAGSGATNVRIETAGGIGDTELFLFGPNSSTVQLAYNDDFGTGKFAQIAVASLVPGTYFARVTSFGQSNAISAYTLRASWTEGSVAPPTGDSFETDDTAAAAKAIANGETQNRSIHVVGDVDFVRFTIGANGATNLRIRTAGVSGDTEIFLFGPNSPTTQLDYNDDAGGGTFSQIVRATVPAGTYLVKVGEFGNDRTISAYALSVSWTDSAPVPPGDGYEIDNTPATAKPIANGQTKANFSIHVAGDEDWSTFVIGPNGASNVRIETAGASGDTEMWLYGPNESTALLAYDDEGAAPGFSRIVMPYLGPGTYFVKVAEFGNNGTIGAYSLRASWTDGVPVATTGGRLVNLSILTSTTPESPTVIVGFVTTGTGAKSFLLRGVGPTLSSLGVGDAMADPKLQLFRGSAPLADNDNWGAGGALRDAATAVGAFQLPDNSRDAAMIQTLGAGAFTVQVNGGNGAVLVEAYEASANLATRLANVSARAFVGSGGGLLAGGFVIGGQGPRTLLIRAVGPGLAPFGVTDFLADPKLDIYSGRTVVQSNDNWGGTAALTATFARVGAFGLTGTSRDSVVLVTLQPGAYSAQVSSVGGAEGSVLLEVYEVP